MILTRIALPSEAKDCPVVIFSHGFGGDLAAFSNSANFWASHGYIVIHPTHADSVRFTDKESFRAEDLKRIFSRSPDVSPDERRLLLVRSMEDPYYLQSRIADITYLAAAVTLGEGIDNRVHQIARRNRLGLAGHSFGAYVTEVIAGAIVSPSVRNAPKSLREHFAAFLTVSGQGAGRLGLSSDSFRSITGPLFQITGTRDIGADGEPPEWRLQAFRDSAAVHKYAALVDGYGHRDFDPPIDGNANSIATQLRNVEVAFFNAWLADDEDARSLLLNMASRSKPQDSIWFRA